MRRLATILLLAIAVNLYAAQVVVDIEVTGTRYYSAREVKLIAGIKVGDEITPSLLSRAIKRILSLRGIETVKIESDRIGTGVKLTYVVKEGPPLRELRIIGNKAIEIKKLLKELNLPVGMPVAQHDIEKARTKILQLYTKEGMPFTSVKVKQETESDSLALTFIIHEIKNVHINSIQIVGANAIAPNIVKQHLKNKERKCYFWKGDFNYDEYLKDRGRLLSFYRASGFGAARLDSSKVVWDTVHNEVDLIFYVYEGDKYYFGDVEFVGNTVFTDTQLRNLVTFEKGDLYSEDKLHKTVETIYTLYGDRAYLNLNVIPEYTIYGDTVDVTFNIKEGLPIRVRRIDIVNNDRTHDVVIRRELSIFPGDLLVRDKLIASQRRVFQLGYFDSLGLDFKPVDNSDSLVDLIIKVKEKQTGLINAGIGYSELYKLVGTISVMIPNFRGRGERLQASFEKGSEITNALFGYTKPWIFDIPLTVGFDLYHTNRYRYYFNERRTGGDIKLSRPIPHLLYTTVSTMYSYELVNVTPVDTTQVATEYARNERRSVWWISLVRDSRDRPFNPTAGSYRSISAEYAGGLLGGTVNYQKYILENREYYKLMDKLTLAWETKLGLIAGYKPSDVIPIYERFFLGGVMHPWRLRGYPEFSVTPKVGGKAIGGQFAITTTFELRYEAQPNIYPLIFFDAGNTWPSFSGAMLNELKKSVGIGVRMEIPMMGIIGFDIAYGWNRVKPGWEFHFSMGGIPR